MLKNQTIKCVCLDTKNASLKGRGYKISTACFAFVLGDAGFEKRYGLPLQREDGKRLQRDEPGMLAISYCPFCGKML